MKIVSRDARVPSGRGSRAAGTACMTAAWLLVALPAMAQDGATQNGVADGPAQQERTGVSHPDPAVITTRLDADDAGNGQTGQPMKASSNAAPTRSATTQTAAKDSAAPVYGAYVPYRAPVASGHGTTAAGGNPAAAFDPDANIVTEKTAKRDPERQLSETEDAAAKIDPDAGIVTHVPSRPGEVPDGTLVKVNLREDLSTLTTKAGTNFTAEVSEPVLRDGQVVVPTGSLLSGRVTLVRGGKRIGGAAAIHLEARTITLPDGSQYLLHARVIDTNSWDDTKVDGEGTILRRDHAKGTAAAIGLSAGGGMAAGAVLGGVPGALIGAGVGAGVSTVVWLRQDCQANLPKDLGIVFSLTEPMRVTPLSASARLMQPAVGGE